MSYPENTATDYAESIRTTLKGYGIKTFVAHIERPNYSGNFREMIDLVISRCRYFILLITIDTFERQEVLRELKVAYPNRSTVNPKLIVFHEDLDDVPRGLISSSIF